MARFPTHLFTVKRKWRTSADSIAYDIFDSLPGSINRSSYKDKRGAYPDRARYWRVCKRADRKWTGYIFRERLRTKSGDLKGIPLPQAVIDKLAAIAMLTAQDMDIEDL